MPFGSRKADAWKDTETSAPVETDAPAANDRQSNDIANNSAACPTGDDIQVDNTIPSQELLKKIADYPVLDINGKSIPFKSIYTGPNVARRVLVIFVRHFYCGNCQEYLRLLSESITPDSLLSLPVPTFIAIVGCGSPTLIKQYAEQTKCPFPLYTDPTRNLYKELNMTSTLTMGPRPDYDRKGTFATVVSSMWNNVKMIPTGKAFAGGDYKQVGGEFLFEPLGEIMTSPVASPMDESSKKELGMPSPAGIQPGQLDKTEEKRITWCHRMRNTRDHAEVPELREVLGLDGHGKEGKNGRRWSRAVQRRKGTGISQMAGVKGSSEVLTGSPSNEVSRSTTQVEGPPGRPVAAPGKDEGGSEPVLEGNGKQVPSPLNS